MKVEKCPRCGKEPICSTFRATDDWFLHEIICFGDQSNTIHHYEHSRSKYVVAFKWNRWARRGAKRIKQEERP